jgi:hypothetical protein
MKYNKEEAVNVASNFLEELKILEKKYGMIINTDSDDLYLSSKLKNPDPHT